jgi:hypothetical protein
MHEALQPWIEEAYRPIDIDEQNAISAWLFAIEKDTPAKRWWNAPIWHPAIGRALCIDRAQHGGVYALAPFRLLQVENRHLIAAAWPCPRYLMDLELDWLDIECIIAWDPVAGTTEVLGDAQAQLVGRFDDDAPTIFGDTHAFFVEWAKARAIYYQRWLDSRSGKWNHPAPERDFAPGKLIVGDIKNVRWAPHSMPDNIASVGLDAQALNKALLRAARVPRVHNQTVRIAA